MITIKPTKAGKEYLNDESGISEKVLLTKIGNGEKAVMESAIKLLKETEKDGEVKSNKAEELNFLIIHKLASVVETSTTQENHLSSIHVEVKETIEKLNPEPQQNALANIHATNEEQLGEVPEKLPTHLGGIKLEEE